MSLALERSWYAGERLPPLRRAAAGVAAGLFGAAVRARNAAFDRGLLSARRVPGLRVLSVGNLNVGGTGKTPVVIHLARLLAAQGVRAVVLSRGYGRGTHSPVLLDAARGPLPDAATAGDEPLLIARSCPGVPVWVGAQRAALAVRAKEELLAQVVLLDDGFQHRQLARDADLVVVDEAVGFGNGRLLPAGPLREPLAGLARAALVWRVEAPQPRPLPPFAVPVVRARHGPVAVVAPDGAQLPLEALRGRAVVAFAGIARPERFLRAATQLGATVVEQRLFADHQPLPAAELEALGTARGAWLLTTEKDLARLPPGFPAHAVRLGVTVLEGEEHLGRFLHGG